MKHPFSLTAALIFLFLSSQIIGLFVVREYVDLSQTAETGEPVYKDLPYAIERPQMSPELALVFIVSAVLIGTGLVFLLMRFRRFALWKLWYFLAVLMTLGVALAAFMHQIAAIIISLIASVLKIKTSNVIVHNLTELFIYGGMAAIFVPLLNIQIAAILLLAISAYDAFAVWKSRHMVKLAKTMSSSGVFAGLSLPYAKGKVVEPKKAEKGLAKTAIIGGGDMGFPLMFAGTVLIYASFQSALIVSGGATIALAALLALGKKGHFYPAMPFISAGCFIGYGISLIL